MKTVVLSHKRDGHGFREATAGLTAPVRPFIMHYGAPVRRHLSLLTFALCITPLILPCFVRNTAAQEPTGTKKSISFSRDIRPILADNCYQCHGPDREQREADLRLDTKDGASAVIKAGDVDGSELTRRITSNDPDEVMPPPKSKKQLTIEQIDSLRTWVAEGAEWESHWAFTAVQRPSPPPVSFQQWPRNTIDYFVLAELEDKHVKPSGQAARATLIRRAFLDIIGLLPSPERVDTFILDSRPDAYERLVAELLDSPHYGERWGRHWLDQARYADSDGYAIDGARVMWPYRDWVIRALNADMPFDQFTIEQIAGDLLDNPTTQQLVATGFHRNTLINQEGGSDPEQFRNEAVVDRVNTTGAVWLGLTVGCAQCHVHKFDPVSQQEYYQLFAFFNSGADKNSHAPQIVADPASHRSELEQLREDVAAARTALGHHKKQSPDDKDRLKQLEKDVKDRENRLGAFERRFGKTMIMRELNEPRETFVLVRGDFLRPAERVTPNVPAILDQLPRSSANSRLDLAHWLVSRANPLTARVTVNRIWMQYFGRGLVETENDFGTQGTAPSHPRLLDWLAAELIHQRWSLKAIHRLIVTSATYRQASLARPELIAVDADNRLLARQARLRVTAEIVHDLALSAAGLLPGKIGGPSVYPPQPDGVYAFTQTKKNWQTSKGSDRFRRGMYTFFYRSAAHPFLTTFDAPNFQTTCTRRLRSNTPLQSLTRATDETIVEAAQALAARVLAESSAGENQRMIRAFRYCMSRPPSKYELERLLSFLGQQRESFEADAKSVGDVLPAGAAADDESEATFAAWVAVSRVLMNLDEFVTRN